MKNIKKLLDVMEKQRILGNHMALGLMSSPGLSKTSQVKQWCEENGRTYFEFVTSQRMPSEISGMPMPNHDTKMMDVYDYEYLLQMEDGDVLAFDEFTNGNIMTLNACLTLIQERHMLSGKDLPSILVVAMGNPQGQCDLLPQTKQRFLWYDVRFNRDFWSDYIKRTYGFFVDETVLVEIEDQYRTGFVTGKSAAEFNYNTPRSMENLLHLAVDLEEDDAFWSIIGISKTLKKALYQTVSSTDEFAKVVSSCIDWAARVDGELKAALLDIGDWKELADLVRDIDTKNLFGVGGKRFIEYLEKEESDSVLNP